MMVYDGGLCQENGQKNAIGLIFGDIYIQETGVSLASHFREYVWEHLIAESCWEHVATMMMEWHE